MVIKESKNSYKLTREQTGHLYCGPFLYRLTRETRGRQFRRLSRRKGTATPSSSMPSVLVVILGIRRCHDHVIVARLFLQRIFKLYTAHGHTTCLRHCRGYEPLHIDSRSPCGLINNVREIGGGKEAFVFFLGELPIDKGNRRS